MPDTLRSEDYISYRSAAAAIFGRHDGEAALDTFGLVDVFADRDHSPAYAFLEAQGYAAAVTPALSLLALADPARDGPPQLLGMPFGRDGLVAVAGLIDGATVVIDRPGVGLTALSQPTPLPRGGSHADDYLTLYDPQDCRGDLLTAEGPLSALRAPMLARTRLGAAAELLGVCDRLVSDALQHVRVRRQFGQPLARFQAVQHLLAWAATEVHQLRCLFDIAVLTSRTAPPDPALAETVKALAGRVLHAVAQIATQVTGAIGFTWEYSLNRLHHRGLLLDQLAGSSGDLVSAIGERLRTQQRLEALIELPDVSS